MKLYKYIALRDGIERVFTHDEVKVNSPSEFNDPFDCNIPVSIEGSEDDFNRLLVQYYRRKYPNASDQQISQLKEKHLSSGEHNNAVMLEQILNHEVIKNQLKNIGVYCMSGTNDNLLMWSHYADGHKGICLEFDGSDANSFVRRARRVVYRDDLPKINFFKVDEWMNEFLITKSKKWEYENEWRIIELKGPGIYQLPERFFSGVILGCKIGEKESTIISWLRERKNRIHLYRAKMKENAYGLEIIDENY